MKRNGFIKIGEILLILLIPVAVAAEETASKSTPAGKGEMTKERIRKEMPSSLSRGLAGEEGGMPAGRWWRMREIADEVKVTNEEKDKLDDLFMKNRKAMIDAMGQVEKEKLELEKQLESKNLDEKQLLGQFRKLNDARNKMSEARFSFVVDSRKLLGYERFQKLKSSFQSRRGRRPIPAEEERPKGSETTKPNDKK